MERTGKCKPRPVRGCFEPNRMEQELLAMAYEQIWPRSRRAVSDGRRCRQSIGPSSNDERASVARSA